MVETTLSDVVLHFESPKEHGNVYQSKFERPVRDASTGHSKRKVLKEPSPRTMSFPQSQIDSTMRQEEKDIRNSRKYTDKHTEICPWKLLQVPVFSLVRDSAKPNHFFVRIWIVYHYIISYRNIIL